MTIKKIISFTKKRFVMFTYKLNSGEQTFVRRLTNDSLALDVCREN